jgi:hypothetical protein
VLIKRFIKITFEDLIAAFIGSLDVIFGSRIIAKIRARKAERNRQQQASV